MRTMDSARHVHGSKNTKERVELSKEEEDERGEAARVTGSFSE